MEWAKAMCQGEGANVNLESDREDEADGKKVKFNIYSVSIFTGKEMLKRNAVVFAVVSFRTGATLSVLIWGHI